MPSTTLAARAARWSAAHRRAAVIGWLAFVVIAYAVGAAAGTVTLRSQDWGNGESLAANRVLAAQFPSERAAEQILIQSRNGTLREAEYRAVVGDLVTRLSRIPDVAQIESPLQRGNAGQRSKDGTAVLVTFQITGDPDTADDRVGPALGRDRRRAGGPRRTCSSASSATRAPTRRSRSASRTTSGAPRRRRCRSRW